MQNNLKPLIFCFLSENNHNGNIFEHYFMILKKYVYVGKFAVNLYYDSIFKNEGTSLIYVYTYNIYKST